MPTNRQHHYRKWMTDLDQLDHEIAQYQDQIQTGHADFSVAIDAIALRQFLIINHLITQTITDMMEYNGNPNTLSFTHHSPYVIATPVNQTHHYQNQLKGQIKALNHQWQSRINPNQKFPKLFKLKHIPQLMPLSDDVLKNMLTLIISHNVHLDEITNRPLPTAKRYLTHLKAKATPQSYLNVKYNLQATSPTPFVKVLNWLLLLRHYQNWLQKRLLNQFNAYDSSLLPDEVKTILKHDFGMHLD